MTSCKKLTAPVCERPGTDITNTDISSYESDETSFTRSISGGESNLLATPRGNLNAFLTSRDVSPIRYVLSVPLEHVSARKNVFTCAKRAKLLLRA